MMNMKKLFAMFLALVFMMSLVTALPVSAAEPTVYVNTDFSDTTKFTAGTSINMNSDPGNTIAPYYVAAASDAYQTISIVENAANGNALKLNTLGSGAKKYIIASFDNSTALQLPEGVTSHKGVFETTFSFYATALDQSIFELGSIVAIRKQEDNDKWGVYARSSDLPGDSADGSYDKLTLLCDFPVPTAATETKIYNLQAVVTISISGTNFSRTVHSVSLDGEEIWRGEQPLSSRKTGIFFNPGAELAGTVRAFSVNTNLTAGGKPAYMNVYTVKYSDYVAPEVPKSTVTAGVPEGNIAPTDDLTFTFSEKMKVATLSSGVKLYEEIKGVADGWNERVCAASLDTTGKILTISFDEGDLAPGTKYKIEFTNDLTTDEGGTLVDDAKTSYVYTTTDNGIYYVNDNFDRYPIMAETGVGSIGKTMYPYESVYSSQNTYQTLAVVENGGRKALQLKAFKRHTNILGYRNVYASVYSGTSHKGVLEIEFALQGSRETYVDIAGMFVIRKDATGDGYGLYARTSGTVTTTQYMADESYDLMVRLADFTVPTSTMSASYTLRCVVTTEQPNSNYYDARTLHSVSLNGNNIPLPDGASQISIAKAGPLNSQGVLFNPNGNGTTLTKLFTIANADASVSYLNVYSVKYSDYIRVDVADGATAGEKSIKVTNNTGSSLTGLVVLAVYDGDTLVGFDGLAAAPTTITNGTNQTFTRTVANAAAGNTYKVMFWNSKVNLQPLNSAIEGEIR